jgi:hypothetical protein
MQNRGKTELDAIIFTEFMRLFGREVGSIVRDDAARYTEAEDDAFEEFDSRCSCLIGYWYGLNPLGKFVDGYQQICMATWR